MHTSHDKRRKLSLVRRRSIKWLLCVLMGFVAAAVVVHVFVGRLSRPRFDLMQNARCVHLHAGHLEDSFVRSDACFSRQQVQQIVTDLVLDSSAAFDAHNLTFFLDSGTMLGSYRNGALILHDQDADIGMDVRSLEYIQTYPIALPDKYELHVLNSKFHPHGTRFKELPARVVHKDSALYLDFFICIDSIDSATGVKLTGPLSSAIASRAPKSCLENGFSKCLTTGSTRFRAAYSPIANSNAPRSRKNICSIGTVMILRHQTTSMAHKCSQMIVRWCFDYRYCRNKGALTVWKAQTLL